MKKESIWIYGIHAVEALLKMNPTNVIALYFDKSKRSDRINELHQLAGSQSCTAHWLEKKNFDKRFESISTRHQGIMAEVKSAPQYDEKDIEHSILLSFPCKC